MDEQHDRYAEDDADDLLRRALIDPEASVAVALKVDGLALADALTVVFHGRARPRHDPDLRHPRRPAAPATRGRARTSSCASRATSTSATPRAATRPRRLYAEQARTLRDALVAADTVLAIWREPLADAGRGPASRSTRSIDLGVRLPAHRLMPVALVAPDRHLTIAPVCGARTLAEGRPPMGIACAQQDVAHVYPLPDDPERCLEDFAQRAADHARRMAERLEHQEASVRRFLELSGGDDCPRRRRATVGASGDARGRATARARSARARRHYAARPVSRRTLIPLIALGVLVFLAISFELARYLNTETQERNAIFVLLRRRRAATPPRMLARLDGCASDPACRAHARPATPPGCGAAARSRSSPTTRRRPTRSATQHGPDARRLDRHRQRPPGRPVRRGASAPARCWPDAPLGSCASAPPIDRQGTC